MIDSLHNHVLSSTSASRRAPPNSHAGSSAPADSQRPVFAAEAASETRRSEADTSRQLQELRARDREVRAHEQAHIAAGGPHVRGGARFSHQRGPDGRYYAVGGEVSIDTTPVHGDPHATLEKAQAIQRAALAPQEPSNQDRTVAARARQMAIQARIEIAREQSQSENEASVGTESANRFDLDTRIAGMGGSGRLAYTPDPLLDTVV